jgi:hypothetical protein
MTTLRHRTTIAALTLLIAGLSACANDPTSPLNDEPKVSADVDSLKRKEPTLPWFNVQKAEEPTLPWFKKAVEPTLPWFNVQKAEEPTLPWFKKTGEPTLPWF